VKKAIKKIRRKNENQLSNRHNKLYATSIDQEGGGRKTMHNLTNLVLHLCIR
jgi:hypothetical protein